MKKLLGLIVLCLGVYSSAAWGQATTSLRGTVTDPSGSAIRGAQVTIVNSSTDFTRTATTGADGGYTFVEVLPGTYALTVENAGFKKYEQAGVLLRVELPATVNVQMKVGSASEVVSVTAEAPALNTTDPSLGHTMGTNEIENLPLEAEQLPLLLSLQPGVIYNGLNLNTDSYDTRAGSVNGEHSDQNNITLDGVSVNDEFNGYAFQGVLPSTPYSVEEFRVTTSNYGASEGRSAGAQIAMVTKSGTNRFHGALYEYNRNTVGEANDYFLKLSQLSANQPNLPQHLVRNLFGGALGGPILKDRLFFFFNYQGERQSYQESVLQNVPTASLADGVVEYQCGTASQCPGGSVTGVSGASYSVPVGYYGLSPANLTQMDPLGVGPSTVAMNYFKSTYPAPNDFTVGNLVNFAGYRFAGRQLISENWYIGRLDYKLSANGNHTLFLRGAGRNDPTTNPPFLPGGAPESRVIDVSKGLVGGYTSVFSSTLVNHVQYGITHQSVSAPGDTGLPWVVFQGLSQPIVYSSAFTAPVHNVADTLTWQKGSHNLQFGTNLLFIRRSSDNELSSFSSALTNSNWIQYSGFANVNSPLNPTYGCGGTGPCYPAVSDGFEQGYNWPVMALMGIVSEGFSQYNYKITNTTAATPLAQGAPISRHWATDTYNFFFQDTWRVRPNISLTYGLNYQLMMPITETNGQEVTPNVNMGNWFQQRALDAARGVPSNQDPVISFQPAGSYYGRTGLYSAQKKNFAPRLGLAWTPHADSGWLKSLLGEDKTVIRAGAGMYFDNFGPALALSYDATGTFGLSTTLENPVGVLTASTAPRMTSVNSIPASITEPAPPSTFPVVYPLGSEAIGNGIDQSLKTPYSYAVDLSLQRQLPGRMTLDVAYVGHFAHRILALDDVAMPMDLVDPKTGIDYFSAAKQISTLWRANTPESAINASTIGPTAQYWQDMLTASSSYTLCSTGGSTSSLLVATYDVFGPGCGNLYNETSGLFYLDVLGFPTTPATGANSYFNSQYSSLWDWRSIGYSNYNALQVGLHKQMTHGVLFGLNYTYSKSMDLESEAERGVQYLTDSIINSWMPSEMYGPSDFDLRHQINGYWVAQLPFGRGREFGGNVSRAADAIIGGWQFGGTGRWSSGFPASVYMGLVWPTNWDEMGWADLTGQPIKTGTTIGNGTTQSNGSISGNGIPVGIASAFKNPNNCSSTSGPPCALNGFNYAFPGESGVRNPIRGDGFFDLDVNLSKSWTMPHAEHQTLQFRWSVFNVTNTPRFDIYSMQDEVQTANTFGNYTQTLSSPREMEFALIYQF
jgi:hypothetical protein